jgi:hypothetical protein
MENDNDKETQAAAEKWWLHRAQDIIDSVVRVEEPASKSLRERAGIPLSGPDDARNWSEWDGPIPNVARVASHHEAQVAQVVLELAKRHPDREIDVEAAALRAWLYVLNHGVYCLRSDAGDGDDQDEWILFGRQEVSK